MTDRDFKLLVREYLKCEDVLSANPTLVTAWERTAELRKRIDQELDEKEHHQKIDKIINP